MRNVHYGVWLHHVLSDAASGMTSTCTRNAARAQLSVIFNYSVFPVIVKRELNVVRQSRVPWTSMLDTEQQHQSWWELNDLLKDSANKLITVHIMHFQVHTGIRCQEFMTCNVLIYFMIDKCSIHAL